LIFLFGGLLAEGLGSPLLFFWFVAAPLFFWSFHRASRVRASRWHVVFWAMLVPFSVFVAAVLARLLVLNFLGSAHAV
jgi:hypothetical protein